MWSTRTRLTKSERQFNSELTLTLTPKLTLVLAQAQTQARRQNSVTGVAEINFGGAREVYFV